MNKSVTNLQYYICHLQIKLDRKLMVSISQVVFCPFGGSVLSLSG